MGSRDGDDSDPSQVRSDFGIGFRLKLAVYIPAPGAKAKPLLGDVDRCRKVAWIKDVVIVNKNKKRTARVAYSPNSCRRQAKLILADMSTKRMPSQVVTCRDRRVRAIIDEQEFPSIFVQCLPLEGLERAAEIVCSRVVRAQDDGGIESAIHRKCISFGPGGRSVAFGRSAGSKETSLVVVVLDERSQQERVTSASQVTKADHELAHAIGGIELYNVPKARPATDLHHRPGLDRCFLRKPRAEPAGEDGHLHRGANSGARAIPAVSMSSGRLVSDSQSTPPTYFRNSIAVFRNGCTISHQLGQWSNNIGNPSTHSRGETVASTHQLALLPD